jgi:hypothetical protein
VLRPGGRFVVGDFGRPHDPVRDAFTHVRSAAAWRSIAGTLEVFVCTP